MRKKRILGQETEYGMIIKQLPRDFEMLEIAKWLYYRFIPVFAGSRRAGDVVEKRLFLGKRRKILL